MADISEVTTQLLIVYRDPETGRLRPYETAYDDDEAARLMERCVERYGYEAEVMTVEGRI